MGLYERLQELEEKRADIMAENLKRGTPKEERERLLLQVTNLLTDISILTCDDMKMMLFHFSVASFSFIQHCTVLVFILLYCTVVGVVVYIYSISFCLLSLFS